MWFSINELVSYQNKYCEFDSKSKKIILSPHIRKKNKDILFNFLCENIGAHVTGIYSEFFNATARLLLSPSLKNISEIKFLADYISINLNLSFPYCDLELKEIILDSSCNLKNAIKKIHLDRSPDDFLNLANIVKTNSSNLYAYSINNSYETLFSSENLFSYETMSFQFEIKTALVDLLAIDNESSNISVLMISLYANDFFLSRTQENLVTIINLIHFLSEKILCENNSPLLLRIFNHLNYEIKLIFFGEDYNHLYSFPHLKKKFNKIYTILKEEIELNEVRLSVFYELNLINSIGKISDQIKECGCDLQKYNEKSNAINNETIVITEKIISSSDKKKILFNTRKNLPYFMMMCSLVEMGSFEKKYFLSRFFERDLYLFYHIEYELIIPPILSIINNKSSCYR